MGSHEKAEGTSVHKNRDSRTTTKSCLKTSTQEKPTKKVTIHISERKRKIPQESVQATSSRSSNPPEVQIKKKKPAPESNSTASFNSKLIHQLKSENLLASFQGFDIDDMAEIARKISIHYEKMKKDALKEAVTKQNQSNSAMTKILSARSKFFVANYFRSLRIRLNGNVRNEFSDVLQELERFRITSQAERIEAEAKRARIQAAFDQAAILYLRPRVEVERIEDSFDEMKRQKMQLVLESRFAGKRCELLSEIIRKLPENNFWEILHNEARQSEYICQDLYLLDSFCGSIDVFKPTKGLMQQKLQCSALRQNPEFISLHTDESILLTTKLLLPTNALLKVDPKLLRQLRKIIPLLKEKYSAEICIKGREASGDNSVNMPQPDPDMGTPTHIEVAISAPAYICDARFADLLKALRDFIHKKRPASSFKRFKRCRNYWNRKQISCPRDVVRLPGESDESFKLRQSRYKNALIKYFISRNIYQMQDTLKSFACGVNKMLNVQHIRQRRRLEIIHQHRVQRLKQQERERREREVARAKQLTTLKMDPEKCKEYRYRHFYRLRRFPMRREYGYFRKTRNDPNALKSHDILTENKALQDNMRRIHQQIVDELFPIERPQFEKTPATFDYARFYYGPKSKQAQLQEQLAHNQLNAQALGTAHYQERRPPYQPENSATSQYPQPQARPFPQIRNQSDYSKNANYKDFESHRFYR